MPIEGIVDHPDFIAMPAAGAGILFHCVYIFGKHSVVLCPSLIMNSAALFGYTHRPGDAGNRLLSRSSKLFGLSSKPITISVSLAG
jgi:hypothetical protein